MLRINTVYYTTYLQITYWYENGAVWNHIYLLDISARMVLVNRAEL